jgi:hypothetical protein
MLWHYIRPQCILSKWGYHRFDMCLKLIISLIINFFFLIIIIYQKKKTFLIRKAAWKIHKLFKFYKKKKAFCIVRFNFKEINTFKCHRSPPSLWHKDHQKKKLNMFFNKKNKIIKHNNAGALILSHYLHKMCVFLW